MTASLVRFARHAGAAAVLLGVTATGLAAQGVTSAALNGRVTGDGSGAIAGATIEIVHTPTGQRYQTRSGPDGRYFFENLQVGGPYAMSVRALGHEPSSADGVMLTLGQRVIRDFVLRPTAVQLTEVAVVAQADPLTSPSRTGSGSFVSESLVTRLPTLNRNFTDFVEMTPQVSRSSAAGANNRFNNIQIDGAVNNDLFGLGNTGQPGGQVSAKAITLEAVSQYEVLIAPFDVRQGGFVGSLVNAVTKRGTNKWHGSAFGVFQNEALVGKDQLGNKFAEFNKQQFGGALGGPIFRDKLHFFGAFEQQGHERPNTGANIDTDPMGLTGINPDSANRFTQIFQTTYSTDPGTYNRVTLPNPNTNAFGRLDWQVAPNHIFTARHNYVKASDQSISRGNNYSWYSNSYQINSVTNSTVLQLQSTFAARIFNELVLQRQTIRDERDPDALFPQVNVTVVSDTVAGTGVATASRTLIAGSEQFSQANSLDQDIYELTDNVTFNQGSHKLTIGTHNEFFHFRNVFLPQATGLWTFTATGTGPSAVSGLGNFELGRASSYVRTVPYPGTSSPVADFRVSQWGLYVQDTWQASPGLSLMFGLRADVPTFPDQPRYNATADTVFGIDTRNVPSGNILMSPRVGFNYDVSGYRRTVLRGGAGLFSGRPPYVWVSNAYGNSGRESVSLSCSNRNALDSVPVFTLDPDNQPTACRNQTAPDISTLLQTVNYFVDDFKFPQTWKLDAAVDHTLPNGFLGSFEVLYTKAVNVLMIRDRNLRAPVSYAADGRPMYGTIGTTGLATTAFVDPRFDKVLEHYNGSGDWSMSITASIQRRFADRFEASASYSYLRSVDRVSLTSSVASSNFAFNPIRGDPNNPELGRSAFEIPHKVTLTGTWDIIRNLQFSVTYVGRTGSPYSYIYQGDANADGYPNRSGSVRGENDLIYVPRNASDISLLAATQWAALDEYIKSEDCLQANRGNILPRNACREPWRNMVNVRMAGILPTVSGHHVMFTLEVFNLLNLVDKDWGLARNATNSTVRILQVRNWDPTYNRPILSFVAPTKNPVDNTGSRWRIQAGARYTF